MSALSCLPKEPTDKAESVYINTADHDPLVSTIFNRLSDSKIEPLPSCFITHRYRPRRQA
jgi:hypothetical protein